MIPEPTSSITTGYNAPPLLTDKWKLRFFTIWIGQAFSLVGSALTQFVLMWWITQSTGSAGSLAIAGIMALLPQAIFGPIGGTVADRFNRKAIMLIADSITALCMVVLIALFATETVQLWHIYALMFIRSTMQAFQSPAVTASTSMLVPEEWLSRVAGLNQTMLGLMTIASAPLGALALAFLPLQGALMIDVVTAVIGIGALLFFRIPQLRTPPEQQTHFWADFVGGVRFVVGHRGLLMLYAINSLVVLTILPTFSLTPLLVVSHFGGGVNEVALIEGGSGIGMLLGGVLVTVVAFPLRRITISILGLAASCLTVALMALAPSDVFWLGAIWWFVSGMTFSMGNAPMVAILQSIIPNQIQGRAFSLLSTLVGLAGPLGLALVGPLAELMGVRGLFIASGFISATICLAAFLSPSLMRLEESKITME